MSLRRKVAYGVAVPPHPSHNPSKLPLSLVDIEAGKRAAEAINLHLTADPANAGRWVAIRMSDGRSDNTVYDTREHAIAHQLDEFLCCYIQIPPTGAMPKECAVFIAYNRALYNAGCRLPDPIQVRRAMLRGVQKQGRALILPRHMLN